MMKLETTPVCYCWIPWPTTGRQSTALSALPGIRSPAYTAGD